MFRISLGTYSIGFWVTYHVQTVFRDHLQIEWVIWKVCHIDHLAKRCIDSLERRRLNQDLMLYYKLQNNLIDSSISNLFKPGYAVTRGNGFQLNQLFRNLNINKYCHHKRVDNIWNRLVCHLDAVSSESICAIKSRLRPVNFDQFLIIVWLFIYSSTI